MIGSEPGIIEKMAFLKLLEIKDSDIRISIIKQGNKAVDQGIHSGGAFSSVIPMVSLYYSGIMKYDVEQPTVPGLDLFVLSKGHAVATLASIYADLGYFDKNVLINSRSAGSILNGHPGPLLPGVHIPTGPMGQGICVAEGFALCGKQSPTFDVFTLTGDGELQEGSVWEALMFSHAKNLDNLCVIVDKNLGQLDNPYQNIFPMERTVKQFKAFGFRVFDVDGMQYGELIEALEIFKYGKRDGRPTAIISNTTKGFGSFSNLFIKHKITLTDEITNKELMLQEKRRNSRELELGNLLAVLIKTDDNEPIIRNLTCTAKKMNLRIEQITEEQFKVNQSSPEIKTKQAVSRNKKIRYDRSKCPVFDKSKKLAASYVITEAMKVFAEDPKVVSVDSDLGTTSGLEGGIGSIDRTRAHNVGIAEANMMCIGEAYAVLGYNVWVSTFCPFFNWNVLRRIGINQQERLEVIAKGSAWLSEGHNLDLTFLATGPNFEAQVNGATHMGNDDTMILRNFSHINIIDISCPNQLLGFMKWVMDGGKGLLYARIMRAPSAVLYDSDFKFEIGRGYYFDNPQDAKAVLVSSGRGVHEIIEAWNILRNEGLPVKVVDMPSVDITMLLEFHASGLPVIFAEQNNGYLSAEYLSMLVRNKKNIDSSHTFSINTLDTDGKPKYINSATYEELINMYGLNPEGIAETVKQLISKPQ